MKLIFTPTYETYKTLRQLYIVSLEVCRILEVSIDLIGLNSLRVAAVQHFVAFYVFAQIDALVKIIKALFFNECQVPVSRCSKARGYYHGFRFSPHKYVC